MIVENIEAFNIEGALRGMRNPMNSWDKSDSIRYNDGTFKIGENDLALAHKLIEAGSEHRKFMRQIMACFDVTAPLYLWKEFSTYKVATTANSCSTMHKIHSKPIEIDDFEINDMERFELKNLEAVVEMCEEYRKKFVETKDKKYWKALIRLLPESYLQRRTITMSFETLYNLVRQRRGHKLTEWKTFIDSIRENLYYAEELIFHGYDK